MREWIVKLSTVDGGAAEALRVIEHFDTLVDQRSSALAMLRAAAALAECPVGLEDPERNMRIGVDAAGRADPDIGCRAARRTARFENVSVWLDREGPPWPLDDLILERFARSLNAVKKARDVSPEVAALRTAFDTATTAADRIEAVRRLGLGPSVTVVATHVADKWCARTGLVVGDQRMHLVAEPLAIPMGTAAGYDVCSAADVARGLEHACTALRVAVDVATGKPIHVRYDALGAIATIVESIDAQTAATVPDVRLLFGLQAQRPWVLPTLEAVLCHSSIREVARSQNLHHSTMRQRVDWLERQLGYSPLDASGYARASVTLTLCRIAVAAGTPPFVGDSGTGRAALAAVARHAEAVH